jgi:hypothetical protein
MGPFLSSSCMAHLSEDREIFDSDNGDLSLPKKISAPPKQVVDLVLDDSDDGVGDNGGDVNEVNLFKNTRNGSISCGANSALVDRPLPDCQPALFSPTVLLAAACRIRSQQPTSCTVAIPGGKNTLRRVSLRGLHCTTDFNSIPLRFFKPQPLMCFTSIRTGPAPTATDFEPLIQRLEKAFLPI